MRNLVLVTKPEDLVVEKAAVTEAHADMQERLAKLKAMAQAPDVPETVRTKIGATDAVEQEYGPIALAIVKLALEGKHDEAIAKMNDDCRAQLAALVKATNEYRALSQEREEWKVAEGAASYAAQRDLLIVV